MINLASPYECVGWTRSSVRIISTLLLLYLIVVFLPHGSAFAQDRTNPHGKSIAVGSLAGKLSVDQGTANYSLSIDVPDGVAGTQPDLALTYSSGSSEGLMGLGWSLQGLSSIARCPMTLAQDGVKRAIRMDNRDRFCLDGQRLIVVNGSYGGNGAEYRTEVDSIARIKSYGSWGIGPAYFTVETKSGLFIEYGKTAASRVGNAADGALSWSQSSIFDSMDNEIRFTYEKDSSSSTLYPKVVEYAPYSNNTFSTEVVFNYELRDVEQMRYVAGISLRRHKRLKSISVFRHNELLHDYWLEYKPYNESSFLLEKLQKCGPASCLPATVFRWTGGSQSFDKDSPQLWIESATSGANRPQWIGGEKADLIDMNGDGLLDRVTDKDYENDVNGTSGTWVSLNDGIAFDPFEKWSNGTPYTTSRGTVTNEMIRDMNGDGLPDRVAAALNCLSVELNTGTGLSAATCWNVTSSYGSIDLALPKVDLNPSHINIDSNNPPQWYSFSNGDLQLDLIDMNGDGLPDRVSNIDYESNRGSGLWVGLNTGTGFAPLSFGSSGRTPKFDKSGNSPFTRIGFTTHLAVFQTA